MLANPPTLSGDTVLVLFGLKVRTAGAWMDTGLGLCNDRRIVYGRLPL